MLLPDNVHPELSIYYNGALVLKELKICPRQTVMDLYQRVNEKAGVSFSTFSLSLDWLYLINMAVMSSDGWVELCS